MSHHVHVQEYSEPRVSGNTIRGVKIIGNESRDRSGNLLHRYPQSVLRKRMGIYEGAPVFIDHRDEREKRANTRNLWAHFGTIVNVRETGNSGLFGDLVARSSHPMAREILEAADNKPKFGLSHDAFVSMNDAETEVTDILELYSVDLVDRTGTTKNLYEGNMETNKATAETTPVTLADLKKEMDDGFAAVHAAFEKLVEVGTTQVVTGKHLQEKAEKTPRITALEPAGPSDNAEAVPVVKTHADVVAALQGWA